MTATTELLMEEIKSTEEQIESALKQSKPTKHLTDKLDLLYKKMGEATAALNESKQILKG